MILKISESVKRNFTELGKDGSIMHMRYRELIKGVERTENEILRDYANLPLKRAKTRLDNLTFDGLLELDSIARLILEKPSEESISPRGYRFLSNLTLSEKEISQVVNEFENLNKILSAESKDLEQTLKNRSITINEEMSNVREQILSGKIIS
jgi:DNA integrity scanning protein DisA with diadenylate cyclase activity